MTFDTLGQFYFNGLDHAKACYLCGRTSYDGMAWTVFRHKYMASLSKFAETVCFLCLNRTLRVTDEALNRLRAMCRHEKYAIELTELFTMTERFAEHPVMQRIAESQRMFLAIPPSLVSLGYSIGNVYARDPELWQMYRWLQDNVQTDRRLGQIVVPCSGETGSWPTLEQRAYVRSLMLKPSQSSSSSSPNP